MGILNIKVEFGENTKSVVANTKIEGSFESEDYTESFIKEKTSLIEQEAKELMDRALSYSKIRTEQKQR